MTSLTCVYICEIHVNMWWWIMMLGGVKLWTWDMVVNKCMVSTWFDITCVLSCELYNNSIGVYLEKNVCAWYVKRKTFALPICPLVWPSIRYCFSFVKPLIYSTSLLFFSFFFFWIVRICRHWNFFLILFSDFFFDWTVRNWRLKQELGNI